MMNMKDFKGYGDDDYIAKMRQLQISYFVQCIDLTNAFNGNVVCDEKRFDYRDIVTHFIDSFPDAPFTQFIEFMGNETVRSGAMTQKEYDDIISGSLDFD